MRLYHDTNIDFNIIDLEMNKNKKKDFGKGFYLADTYKDALEWSILKSRNKNVVIVKEYRFNEEKATKELNILNIKRNSINDLHKWIDIITYYRDLNIEEQTNILDNLHVYDMIIGPVFDNGWYNLFKDYIKYRDINSLINRSIKNQYQYVFKSEKSIEYLEEIRDNIDTKELIVKW